MVSIIDKLLKFCSEGKPFNAPLRQDENGFPVYSEFLQRSFIMGLTLEEADLLYGHVTGYEEL